MVSDGNIPAGGEIPAFITGMIVLRKVIITRNQQTSTNPVVLHVVSGNPIQGSGHPTIPGPGPGDPGPGHHHPLPIDSLIATIPNLSPNINVENTNFILNEPRIHTQFLATPIRSPIVATAGHVADHPANIVTDVIESDTDISLLAFICKRIPKSPNPDNTLTW
jgi:hypothetical protein